MGRHWKAAGILMVCLASAAKAAPVAEITMASSSSSPPYIIPTHDAGIVVEVIRAAFAKSNTSVKFIYAPNLRVEHELESRRVDGVYAVPNDPNRNYFISAPILYYNNIAVSLSDRALKLDTASDLRGLKIATFQNATRYLGDEFATAVRDSVDYIEVSNQYQQVAMLFNHRVDVIILEQRIFEYYRRTLGETFRGVSVEIHPIFSPASRHAGFASKDLRDQFDSGLKAIQYNGEFDRILDSYGR